MKSSTTYNAQGRNSNAYWKQSLNVETDIRNSKNQRECFGRLPHRENKPRAPRLKELAVLIGEEIYDIYTPPLPNAGWQKQG